MKYLLNLILLLAVPALGQGVGTISFGPTSASGPPQAATPTFSPVGGSYSGTQTVTISDSTPSPTIYYTTDGSTPTTGSTVYSTPISVAATTTVKAIATASGYSQSAVGSATYTITASNYVQSCGFNNANFSPTSLTCSGVVTGHTLMFGMQTNSTTTISSCTDSSGDTPIVYSGTTNGTLAAIVAVYNATAGTHTVHCTFASGDTLHSYFSGDEYSGVAASPYDGSVIADCSTSGSTCGVNPSLSPAWTTANNNDVIWGFCYMASGSTGGTTSPITYTKRSDDSPTQIMWSEDGILTTAGSIKIGCFNQFNTGTAAFLGLALHP